MKKALGMVWRIIIAFVLCVSLGLTVTAPVAAESNGTATPESYLAGACTDYTITFTTTKSALLTTLDLEFPAGFDVSGVSADAPIGINPGSVFVNNQIVTFVVSSPAMVAAGTTITLPLTGVINTATPGTAYFIQITTKTSTCEVIDTINTGNFSIITSDLDHYSVVPAGNNQTAGVAFNVVITAKDKYNNTIMGYDAVLNTGSYYFSGPDYSPKDYAPVYPLAPAFSGGVWTASITLYRAESVKLTVSDYTISGTTETDIVVAPDAPTGVVVNTDAEEPVTAGETVTFRAKSIDNYGNRIEDVTANTVFSADKGAGGAWSAVAPNTYKNVYTTEKAGTWKIKGTWTMPDNVTTRSDNKKITVSADTAAKLTIISIPTSAAKGWPLGNVEVLVQDRFDNPVPGCPVKVEAFSAGKSQAFSAGITVRTTDEEGIALFNDLVIDTNGTFNLEFTTEGVAPVASDAFQVYLQSTIDVSAGQSIQSAINEARDLDLILVHPGTYNEFITIDKPLIVQAYRTENESGEVIIQPQVVTDFLTLPGEVVAIKSGGVTFTGFSVIIDGYLTINQDIAYDLSPDTAIAVDYLLPAVATSINDFSPISILNNTIKIDRIPGLACGIGAYNFPGDLNIQGNTIILGKIDSDEPTAVPAFSVGSGYGIDVSGGATVRTENNSIEVYSSGELSAGIHIVQTDSAWVNHNNIYVDAEVSLTDEACYTEAWGIAVNYPKDPDYWSVKVQVDDNKVFTRAIGYYSLSYPISICRFERAEVKNNTQVDAEAESTGGCEAWPIYLKRGEVAVVIGNTGKAIASSQDVSDYTVSMGITAYNVDGLVEVSQNNFEVNTLVDPEIIQPQEISDIESPSISDLLDREDRGNLSTQSSYPDSIAESFGIWLRGCAALIKVNNNVIDAGVQAQSGNAVKLSQIEGAVSRASGYSGGILLNRDEGTFEISGNNISAITDLVVQNADGSLAVSMGNSEAYGLYLKNIDAEAGLGLPAREILVEDNIFTAKALGTGGASSEDVNDLEYAVGAEKIKTRLLQRVFEQIGSISQTVYMLSSIPFIDLEVIDFSNEIASINSTEYDEYIVAGAQAVATAIGIYAQNTPGIQIQNNNRSEFAVSGDAQAVMDSVVVDNSQLEDPELEAFAVGYSWSTGIILVNCPGSLIDNNTIKSDSSTRVTISASLISGYEAYSYLSTRNMSAGILSVSVDTEEIIDPEYSGYGSTFSRNNIEVNGETETKGLFDDILSGKPYLFQSTYQQLTLGIVSLPSTSDTISGNNISVSGVANALTTDPDSLGPALCLVPEESYNSSIGVFTYNLRGLIDGDSSITINNNQINTQSDYTSEAYFTSAVTSAVPETEDFSTSTESITGSIGALCIGGRYNILGNQMIRGDSSSEVTVHLVDDAPLDIVEVNASTLSCGLGLVLISTNDTVVNRNNFGSGSEANVISDVAAPVTVKNKVAVSVNADISAFIARAEINYNNIGSENVGIDTSIDKEYVKDADVGLLPLESDINARYNWWGDATGPSAYVCDTALFGLEEMPDSVIQNMPEGFGAAVAGFKLTENGQDYYWSASYDWWLSHPIEDLDSRGVGYYGFSVDLDSGWNTLSAPMSLEQSVWTNDAGTGLADVSRLEWEIAYYYDPTDAAQPWKQITSNSQYRLEPLNGIYVRMNAPGTVFMGSDPNTSAPQRSLTKGQSWYLIGPTPCGNNFPFTRSISIEEALVSIQRTADGKIGYDQVVSPAMSNQAAWSYTLNSWYYDYPPEMEWGRAYWVFMENPDTLAGSIFTPLPVELPTSPLLK